MAKNAPPHLASLESTSQFASGIISTNLQETSYALWVFPPPSEWVSGLSMPQESASTRMAGSVSAPYLIWPPVVQGLAFFALNTLPIPADLASALPMNSEGLLDRISAYIRFKSALIRSLEFPNFILHFAPFGVFIS